VDDHYPGEDGHRALTILGKGSFAMFKVGDRVRVVGDSRIWIVTAHNVDSNTYDLELDGDPGMTMHNVPEGDMSIAT
jgi:hypothetical protein